MTTKNYLRSLLAILFVAFIGLGASAQLPSVQLKNLNGKPVNTAKLSNDGKPFVISFFATWCKPCLRELKAIAEVYPEWQDETGMKLIAISIDEAQNASKVRPLVDSEGWEYEVLLDPNSDFARSMGVQNIPHVFVVDGKGKIVYNHAGYSDGSESAIIKKIREVSGK